MRESDVVTQAYLRPDGGKGIRNKVLVVFTVECSMHVCQKISEHFQRLGHDVEVIGNAACLDNQVTIRRLLRYSVHPNTGAVLAIGLGCEYVRPDLIARFAIENGRLGEWFYLQECGGTEAGIQKGVAIVEDMLAKLENVPRGPMYVRDLVIGGECGGSDFTSGLAGNALVGSLFDQLVDAGATCVFEELSEAIGLKDFLAGRGASEQAKREIADTYDKTVDFCRAFGQFSISPGNFVGGLTTIEEKSMGAVAKSGSRPIEGVLKIAQAPRKNGLWLLDVIPDEHLTPCYYQVGDATHMSELIAAGCHLVLLVTGRGHVVGAPVSPVLKITGNSRTYQKLSSDIDLDASVVLTGEKGMDELTLDLFGMITWVCSGEKTSAERLGHRENHILFNYQSPDRVRSDCRF